MFAVVAIIVPPAVPAGTAVTIVNVPLAPAARLAIRHTTTFVDTGGVVHTHPAGGVTDWNVLGPVIGNVITDCTVAAGPLFITITV